MMRDLNPKMKAINAAGFLSDVVGAAAYSAGKAKTVPGLVLRGNQLTFKLTRPAPDFLSRIAMPFFCALPLSTPIDARGLQGSVPGAGPYYLKSWTPKQQFVLARNPNYKGTRPHTFDSMVFTVGKSPDASLLEVKAGQSDYAMDGVSPSAYGQLWDQYGPGKKDQRLFVNPLLQVNYLALNTSRPTFARQSLRQAVAYAIDRGALLDQLGAHAGIPAEQLLPPTVLGYKPVRTYPLGTPTKADLAKAKQLAAGARDTVTMYTCNSGPCPGQAALVQAYLAQIGLTVKVVSFERVDAVPEGGPARRAVRHRQRELDRRLRGSRRLHQRAAERQLHRRHRQHQLLLLRRPCLEQADGRGRPGDGQEPDQPVRQARRGARGQRTARAVRIRRTARLLLGAHRLPGIHAGLRHGSREALPARDLRAGAQPGRLH